MDEITFFRDVGFAILGAALFAIPAQFLRFPILLAYLVAGVVLGPHLGFGLIQGAEHISMLSEIGLILLMFILGLEIDIRKLLLAGKAIIVNGVTQFIGCFFLGIAFFYFIGYRNHGNTFELIYLSMAASLSSTLIVVKILSDKMELDSFLSRITLGILVFQDLWAIAFLAVQPNLGKMSINGLMLSLGGAVLLVLLSYFLARFVLPKVFLRVAKSSELILLVSMAWCFAMCALAQHLKLSVEIGALLAGLMIASLPYHIDIAAKVASLRDFFITLFFVALGLRIPKPTIEVLYIALVISGFVLVSRVIVMYPVLYKMKYGNRASLLPALNLSQLSEFSLVIGAIGLSYGHIRQEVLSGFILALVITAMLSSYLINEGHNIFKKINPFLESIGLKDRISVSKMPLQNLEDEVTHDIVLLGFFREASSLLQELMTRHSSDAMKRFFVVDYNPEAHQKLVSMGIKCLYGDIGNEATLKGLRLEKTKIFVCTIPDHNLKGTTNLKLLKILKEIAPEAKIIVTAESMHSARQMYFEGAEYVFLPRIAAAHYLADVLERISLGEEAVIKQDALLFLRDWKEVID